MTSGLVIYHPVIEAVSIVLAALLFTTKKVEVCEARTAAVSSRLWVYRLGRNQAWIFY
jgi:hypothetical protein